MKQIIILLVLLLVCLSLQAQSRFYISSGLCVTRSKSLYDKPNKQPIIGAEWERKLAGSFHSLIGISYYTASYHVGESELTSASDFNGKYLAAPILLRFNVGNKNQFYIDAGPNPYLLLKASLAERIERFPGIVESYSEDITKYSDRLFLSFLLQATYAINRFSFTAFFVWQGDNSSTGDLADHWFLNVQESTYLVMGGYSDFKLLGLRVGIRIR